MSRDKKLEFFVYSHANREFLPASSDAKKLSDMISKNPEDIGKELAVNKIDSLLVLDTKGERWLLAYSDELGIVGQRTARRQADTIARSGYRMPEGYTIKGNYPLDEFTEVDIGDLWKTVQQKYVQSDLKGLEIDEATGLPSQLAERDKVLEKVGESDGLTAGLEKEEAERRRKAIEKSEGKSSTPAKSVAKKPAKAPAKKATKKSSKKAEDMFFEISSVKQNVVDGKTQTIARGKLTVGTEEPVSKTILFDQDNLTNKEWTQIGIFLQKGDVVQVTLDEDEDGGEYATSVKM